MDWKKSSYSGTNGSCWEVASDGATVYVRNSNRPDAGTLALSVESWGELLSAAKRGELDNLL